MSALVYVGIDPGQSGALVAISEEGRLIAAHRTPLFHGMFDVRAAAAIFESLPRPFVALIEAAIPTGRSKTAYADSGFLAIKRSIAGWRAATRETIPSVSPRQWQSRVLEGIPGETTKEQSVEWCRRALPELNLLPGKCRNPHDGLADAACLAEYFRLCKGVVPSPGGRRRK